MFLLKVSCGFQLIVSAYKHVQNALCISRIKLETSLSWRSKLQLLARFRQVMMNYF